MYSDAYNATPDDEPSSSQDEGGCSAKGRFSLEEVTDLNRNGNDLVRPCDIKGILHSHSRYTDGAHPLTSMVATAQEIGLEYLGVSDHFHSEVHQQGLGLADFKVQRQEIDILREKFDGFDILQGVELDANPDGTLPLDDGTLLMFDYVIVSFPEFRDGGGYDRERLTEQAVRVAGHPLVTILGRPVGDCILRCTEEHLDMDRLLAAAAEGRTALELNANPSSVEIDWGCCRRAQDQGVYLAISPNAHRAARLVDYRHGAELAHEAGIRCGSLLNTMTSSQLRDYLQADHS